jgi:hypothetical protein
LFLPEWSALKSEILSTPRTTASPSMTKCLPRLLYNRTTLTFDCYGTLIDWETGTVRALRPLLLRHGIALSDDEIVTAFQDIANVAKGQQRS